MLLTVFTPTYNRAYCLNRLYESLERQTDKDFLWMIIDDGSEDDTEEKVKKFAGTASFPIVYEYQENAGKHAAYNRAVKLCDTELFFCVDSDDFLTDDAVEAIKREYLKVKNEDVLGLYFKKITCGGDAVSTPFPAGLRTVGITDLYHKYGFRGDTAIILRTALIKDLFFPVFPGERFVTERVLYNKYNSIAPMAIADKGIYVAEYLPDGYSGNIESVRARNPYGTALDYLSEACCSCSYVDKAKYYAQFISYCRIFSLDKRQFEKYEKPRTGVRIAGKLLSPHYDRIFVRHRERA